MHGFTAWELWSRHKERDCSNCAEWVFQVKESNRVIDTTTQILVHVKISPDPTQEQRSLILSPVCLGQRTHALLMSILPAFRQGKLHRVRGSTAKMDLKRFW